MSFRRGRTAHTRLMTNRHLRHELRQYWLTADWVNEEWPTYTDREMDIRAEIAYRLQTGPVEECVCEECWPELPLITV